MTFAFERVRETDFADDALRQALALAHKGYQWSASSQTKHDSAVLWTYTPIARQNAFQNLLYSEAWNLGVAPLGVIGPQQCLAIPWDGPHVLHLHWLNGVTHAATSESEAEEAADRFDAFLAEAVEHGVLVVWTIHNVLPHDAKWPDADRRVRQLVARHARVIHVMTTRTADESAACFTVDPAKVVHAPHPLYAGVYPNYVSRDEARFQVGVAPDDVLLLCFGAVQPYKGYSALMDAFDRAIARRRELGRRGHLRLLIAGHPAHSATARALRDWQAGREDVLLRLKRIVETEVQYLFNAADAVVCPYERTLNSGVALLAATFGVPVIGPAKGGFTDNLPAAFRRLYDEGHPDGLTTALADADLIHAPNRSPDVLPDELMPAHVSRQFLTNVLHKLGLR